MTEQEQARVQAALQDRGAFAALTEPYRHELQVHCYRMLGSLMEAEDMVQDTLLKAWVNRESYAGRGTLRAWLYKIATNTCLDEIARRPRRGLPMSFSEPADPHQAPGEPVLDPIWLEPYPDRLLPSLPPDPAARFDQGQSVRLAFLVALQELPPRQRVVLLLRDVLGWPAAEVAGLLDASVSAVHSALYRARGQLSAVDVDVSDAAVATDPSDSDEQLLLDRYVHAWEAADIERLTLLLKEDATFPMPPLPGWYRGREDIIAFVSATVLAGEAADRWRFVPTRANGLPAFGLYRRPEDGTGYEPFAIQLVTLEEGRVADATTFGFPRLFEPFGLPPTLPD